MLEIDSCKKRIGILSLYYNNLNYGGVLQAYALCHVLNAMGYDAEQICIQRVFHTLPHKRTIKDYLNPQKYYQKLKIMLSPKIETAKLRPFTSELEIRSEAVRKFRDKVPHSNSVYTDDTISDCIPYYDIFIAGSDQVWGITQNTSPYLMNFVPKNKLKLSYAASMGYASIDKKTEKIYIESLKSYKAISVREKDAVNMLTPLTDTPVVQCLDPTLLLCKNEWDEIASERKIEEPYVLCYFLGDDKRLRSLVAKYARKKNLKIVTFPHCPAVYHKTDIKFGDYCVYDAGPEDFISYIKYAERVFTDSFHGAVFSLIYQKKFLVFNRKGEERMISRIYSLMDLFGTKERMILNLSDTNFNDIANTIDKKIEICQDVITRHIQDSVNFLCGNLK